MTGVPDRRPRRWSRPSSSAAPWGGAVLLVVSFAAVALSTGWLVWAVPAAVAALLAGRWPGDVRPALLAFAMLVAAGAVVMASAPGVISGDSVAVLIGAGMVPWLAGLAWRQATVLSRSGWQRAERLDRERQMIVAQARLRERARIAQDMHDGLGHELNLIALRAGALKLTAGSDEHSRAAADEVRAGAAAAIERLSAVIGVLNDSAEPSAPPAPGGVPAIVERAAAAGIRVRLTVEGDPPVVDVMHDHAVDRVVQEALTNVAKHAPAGTASVHLRYGDAQTLVRVDNAPVTGPPAGSHDGVGLTGLHERVRLAGGTSSAGPRDDGWRVEARLPHTASPVAPPTVTAVEQHHRARRQVRRSVLALALLPAPTFVVLYAGVWIWSDQVTGRAVLDAEDFSSLRPGLPRVEVAPLLPRRQVPRPAAVSAAPPGAACEYYAVTRDRLDSRSGDAYRLCFRDGVLTGLDVITG